MILDFVVPPLVYSNETTLLRDSTESTALPSTMQDFFSLLHSEGLLKTLETCSNDCLYYSISDSPYQLMSLSMDLGMEYIVYFLVEFQHTRLLWDPLFLGCEEIERIDQNNRILRVMYKPMRVPSISCELKSHLRDFCVFLHYSYDEDSNTYFILFKSTTHHQCLTKQGCVRGDMSKNRSKN